MSLFRWAFCFLLSVICSCSGAERRGEAIPRRPAYPRPWLYPMQMDTMEVSGMRFLVNSEAQTAVPRGGWLDVAYPRYGATIHTTFTPVDEASSPEAIANRLERIALNGGEPVAEDEWVNPAGFRLYLVITRGSQTPIQFLACDSTSMLVSGTVFFADPAVAVAPDSIAPVVEAVKNDIVCALNSLAEYGSISAR